MSTPLHHGCDCEHCQRIAETYDYLESLHTTLKNTKGRIRPQAIRQARARTKAYVRGRI